MCNLYALNRPLPSILSMYPTPERQWCAAQCIYIYTYTQTV